MQRRINQYLERAEDFEAKADEAEDAARKRTFLQLAQTYRILAAEYPKLRDDLSTTVD